MPKPSIKHLPALLVASLGLIMPAPALAAVNPDAPSAAAAGIQYLSNNQQANGSISGFGGESEWSAEAIKAGGQDVSAFAHGGSSLLDFLKANPPAAGAPTTTIERKIIAIAAAGQDPAAFGGVDYESLLLAQRLGGQIGDATLINDDIFGIIAIDASHDASLIPEAQDGLDYLLAHQQVDGGFSYTTASCTYCGEDNNDTAAALIAMYAASDLGLVNSNLDAAKSKALAYLLSTQQSDGGFGYDPSSPSDGSSTSWSLMALNTLGASVADEASLARGWLLENQNADGGFSFGAYGTTGSDTYTTAHAVIALLGSTWLLNPTPLSLAGQPVPSSGGSGSGTPAPTPPPETHTQAVAAANNVSPAPVNALPESDGAADSHQEASQVKAASTTAPSRKPANTRAAQEHKTKHISAYAVGFLIIAALTWFVIESRKSPRKVNHEN